MGFDSYRTFKQSEDSNSRVEETKVSLSYHEVEIPRGTDSSRDVVIPKGHTITPLASEYQGQSADGQTWRFKFILMGPTE